jgi:hypothetical protein
MVGRGCDDGNACTRDDVCRADGSCAGTPIACGVPDQCHVAGTCDPKSGACSNPPAPEGTACGKGPSCAGGVGYAQDACDGHGTCASGAATPCGRYRCNAAGTACLSRCGNDDDCAADNWCSGGACVAKGDSGATCTAPTQCLTGHCVDGVCCTSACTDRCHTCARNGYLGTCVAESDGTPCDDGQSSTCGDVCWRGVCSGSPRDFQTDIYNCGICGGFCEAVDACTPASCTDGVCNTTSNCVSPDVCDRRGECTIPCPSPGVGSTYQYSCTLLDGDCSEGLTGMTAMCRDDRGMLRLSSIVVNDCASVNYVIGNCNGQLTCGGC